MIPLGPKEDSVARPNCVVTAAPTKQSLHGLKLSMDDGMDTGNSPPPIHDSNPTMLTNCPLAVT